MIRFTPDETQFFARMRVRAGSAYSAECAKLCRDAALVARPRLLWRKRNTVFPFIASCGPEIIEWRDSFRAKPLRYFWADALAELALDAAITELEAQLQPLVGKKHLASLHPGDSPRWPLSGQRQLFAMLGCRPPWLRLTREGMMLPIKSLSGIYFSTDTPYNNCTLCLRRRCEKRRSAYLGIE